MFVRILGLSAVASAIAVFFACSPPPPQICPNGMWPYDDMTSVPLDTVLEIRIGEPLPHDVPPLDLGIHLRNAQGPVALSFEVDAAEGLIRATPAEPLLPGEDYWLSGIDWHELDLVHPHWWPGRDFGRDHVEISFSTGGTPSYLGTAALGDGQRVMVFSEAVDPDSLADHLRWVGPESTAATDTGEAPESRQPHTLAARVEGPFFGQSHMIVVQGPPRGAEDYQLEATEGVISEDGALVRFDGPGGHTYTEYGESFQTRQLSSAVLPRFRGEPFCASLLW
ncbi:MAG: hypothetical protein KTR31_18700 [Myxococcales bacterium]|nr:hypothetical protein [Myxococcales bacterium]